MDSKLSVFSFVTSVICIQLSFILGSSNKCVLVNRCCVARQFKIGFLPRSVLKYRDNQYFILLRKETTLSTLKFCKNCFKVKIRKILKLIKNLCM
jgi:hypothetical protein